MKPLPLLLCLLVFAAAPLSAVEDDSTPAPKKKHSKSSTEKAKADADSTPPLKPFVTPAPTKKKAAATEDEDTPAPKKKAPQNADSPTPSAAKKKKPSASDDDATPAPKKKKSPVGDSDDATPAPKKKKSPASDEDDIPATSSKKSATPTKDDDESVSKTSSLKSAPPVTPPPKGEHAPAATLDPAELAEFAAQPERVQQLLTAALALTKLNLTYTFGSADPSHGGMDCSGTIYHLLHTQGFDDVPRDSSSQYEWARKGGRFYAVISTQADGFEFKDLQPGDLMFWTGTYQTGREIPISHVMLYLGHEKKTGKRVMFGASDGRSYNGIQRWGVSVFDFKMPKADPANPDKHVDFVGYAPIPGLRPSK